MSAQSAITQPKIHSILVDEIRIAKNRYRKEFIPERVLELASSIAEIGLLQPVILRRTADGGFLLCAGERRIRALEYLWNFGNRVNCSDFTFPERHVPCLLLEELNETQALQIEVEENVCRVDFTWQEKAQAVAKLMELRSVQAATAGKPTPTVAEISEEIHGTPLKRGGTYADTVRQQLIVAKHLDNPEVSKAKTVQDAFKELKRAEQIKRNVQLAAEVGVTFNSSVHQLFNGDCREIVCDFAKESFDVILTDPPYGIDADTYGDSGGAGGSRGSHFYDDSWSNWNRLMQWLAVESFRVAKPHSHLYCFCDIDNFVVMKGFFIEAGWNVFRTPMVWFKPSGSRAPWSEKGPQRKYEVIMYAVKGERTTTRLLGDVLNHSSDPQLNHPAQKPVSLYKDLLSRSVNPGDSVADFFMGTGPIIPAAHELKCKATGIEMDPGAYGTAITRLKGLE